MKKMIILAFLIGSAFLVSAQMTLSSGSQVVVASGSYLVVNDVDNTSGTIDNAGTVSIKGDVTNNSGGLFDSGSAGTVTFTGSSAQEITGAATVHFYGALDINNSNGVSITSTTTGAAQEIHGTLGFTSGKLTLNAFDLTLDGTADPTGVGATAYIVSNSTGNLKRSVPNDGSTNIIFPVGNSAYNPITLQNSGTATTDTYSVRVADSKPASFSGTTHIVNRSWVVSEETGDGSDLTVTTQWNSGEEAAPFDETNSAVGVTTDNGATVTWGSTATATGASPYYRSTNGITSVGTFMVGDSYYSGKRLNLSLLLAGAFNSGTMTQNLYSNSLIPLDDPYGLGTSVASVPSTAVDWVVVRLRDKTNSSSILHEFAFFVNADGELIHTDGSTGGNLTGITLDNYYIELNHRNHNGVMTINTLDLTQSSPSFDFTANLNIYGTDAQVDLGNGDYGLRKGNVNNDGRISKVGPPTINDYTALLNVLGANTFLLDTYSDADINMDGDVRKVGPVSINDYSALLNSLGSSTSILEQLP